MGTQYVELPDDVRHSEHLEPGAVRNVITQYLYLHMISNGVYCCEPIWSTKIQSDMHFLFMLCELCEGFWTSY